MALLVLLSLTGCSASSPAETTVPPTEATPFFEEQGLTAWDGFAVEADPEVREIHATAEISNIAEVFFYEKEGDTATEIVHKEIIDGEAEVHIAAYYPEEFSMPYLSDIVASFYQKAVEDGETATKEEWISAHGDYVIYNCWMIDQANWAQSVDTFCDVRNTDDWNSTILMNGLYLMDGATGSVYYPTDESSGIVARFPLHTMGEHSEMLAVYHMGGYASNSETSANQDFGGLTNLFIMVPKTYDRLVFVCDCYADFSRTNEELLAYVNGEDEEPSKWEQMTYQEYKDDNPYLVQYFFDTEKLMEAAANTAPVVGDFFDRMGIHANMEKFEVTETVLETGVKETHWFNSITVPGAEMHYFNSDNETVTSYVDKGLANCKMDVTMREYPAAQFESKEVQSIINEFYAADGTGISRQQWLQDHQNYKLIHYSSETDFWAGHCTRNFFAGHAGTYWYTIYANWNKLIDRYTGMTFRPQNGSDGVVEEVETNGVNFSVMNTRETEWYKPTTQYNNFRVIYNMYILIPADYDGLVYALDMYEKNRSDEDILELLAENEQEDAVETQEETDVEISTWWSGNFYDEDPHLKRYYFIPAQ